MNRVFKLSLITALFFSGVLAMTPRGTGTDPYDPISHFNHDYVYFTVDVLNAGSYTTTNKVTFQVLRDSIAAYVTMTDVVPDSVYLTYNAQTKLTLIDGAIGEGKLTAALNARLDSFLTAITVDAEIAGNATVVANAGHRAGDGSDHADVLSNTNSLLTKFPYPDSSHVTSPIYPQYNDWYLKHNLYMPKTFGTARIDSLLLLGDKVYLTDPYITDLARIIISDTMGCYQQEVIYPFHDPLGPGIMYATRLSLAKMHHYIYPSALEPGPPSVGTLYLKTDVGGDRSVKDVDVIRSTLINKNIYGANFVHNYYGQIYNYGPVDNIKGAWFSTTNNDTASNFIYGFQASPTNQYNANDPDQRDVPVYTPNLAGLRLKVINYTNGGVEKTVTADQMYGFSGWLVNQSAGSDSALVDKAYYLYGKNQNLGIRARIDSLYGLYLETPTNEGLIKKNAGIYIASQDVGATHNQWNIESVDYKSYIHDLYTNDITVGDSTITESDIAAWDAAADSVDQDLRTTASPTFGGLAMNGDVDMNTSAIIASDGVVNIDNDLTVVDATGTGQLIFGSATNSDARIILQEGGSTRWQMGFDAGNADAFTIDVGTLGTNSIFIIKKTSYDIGIGTQPTARLHVKGSGATSSTYAVKVDDSASANLFNIRDDGVSTFSGTVTVADSIHIGDGVTYSYAVPGDASLTTSSDSTKKCNIIRKKPDKSKQQDRLDAILKIDEAEYNYDRDAIRKKFDKKYVQDVSITKQIDDTTTVTVPYDSMTISQQDSIMYAWVAKEEKRVDRIASKKRYGPMAQDVASAFGGDGKSINWDQVNSEYRLAVQELIVLVREQQAQIDALEKRVGKLENKKGISK